LWFGFVRAAFEKRQSEFPSAFAIGLNEKGIPTPRNGNGWTATQVGRLLQAA